MCVHIAPVDRSCLGQPRKAAQHVDAVAQSHRPDRAGKILNSWACLKVFDDQDMGTLAEPGLLTAPMGSRCRPVRQDSSSVLHPARASVRMRDVNVSGP
jgi:hypothetical protein